MKYFFIPGKKERGISLIQILIGASLLLIVFLGFFYAYQLTLKVVGQNKNKVIATAVANGELERIRNLPYQSIGIKGGFPDGVLDSSTTTVVNNIDYTITRRIDYVVDFRDGIAGPEDDCPNDYKKVGIKISWSGILSGEVNLISDISPQTLAQECGETGGVLLVSVFDAYGAMVASPLIEVKNSLTGENIKTAVPDSGEYFFSLPVGTYKIVVSKSGHSGERTYGTDEITTPEKPHLNVLENQLTKSSFSIDKVSSFPVDTLSPWGSGYFSDSFLDESKVLELVDLTVGSGEVDLAGTASGYENSGFLISISTVPTNLLIWDEFSFDDSEPQETQILYHILYFDGASWILIPDADLPDNSAGFGSSPVDLSGLDINTYSQLELKGIFSTIDENATPVLYDWQLSWKTTDATPIGNATFHLRGEKIIGADASGTPVCKYSQDHISGSDGHIDILDIEWDNYTFSIDPSTGLDLTVTIPSPQPIGLSPDTSLPVALYLESQNSFLVTIKNIDTGEPVFGAGVRLYNSDLSYDKTQNTNEKGQTYFIPLEPDNYTIDVQAGGYNSYSGTVSVLGDESKIISLQRVE